MLVPNQKVEVIIGSKNMKYYNELGYNNLKKGDNISVPIEYLSESSRSLVKVQCDICGEIFTKSYTNYIYASKRSKSNIKIDVCGTKCRNKKRKMTCVELYGSNYAASSEDVKNKIKQTNLERYGVENYSSTQECRDKVKNTCLKKYGVEVPLQNQEILEKQHNTMFEKYGVTSPIHSDIFRKKTKQTCLEKYGVEYYLMTNEYKEKAKATCIEKYGLNNYSSTEECRIKVKQTCLERYGTESTLQVPEFREKALKTMSQNGTVPTSSQQIALYNVVKSKYNNAEINYPFSNCCLDIFISVENIKIDIEYDGWYWHQDKHKDIKRDKFLQKNDFKVLRVRSGSKLPTEEQLFEAINKLVETDYKYTEIILDDWKDGEESA